MTFSDVYKVASMSQGGPPTASASTPMQGTTLQYSLQVAEVEVDPDTGEVKVMDLTVVQDAGFAINQCQLKARWRGGYAGSGLRPGRADDVRPSNGPQHQRRFS